MSVDPALFPVRDGPDQDGFIGWTFPGDGYNGWLGRLAVRDEGADTTRVRIATGPRSVNINGTLHGGFLLGFLDQALFVGPCAVGRLAFGGAVTLNLATQFVAPGTADRPLDALVSIVRETGRLFFLRGSLEQGDTLVLTFQATLAKRRPPSG